MKEQQLQVEIRQRNLPEFYLDSLHELQIARKYQQERYSGTYTVEQICAMLSKLRFQPERMDCLSYCITSLRSREDCSQILKFLRTPDELAYFSRLCAVYQY